MTRVPPSERAAQMSQALSLADQLRRDGRSPEAEQICRNILSTEPNAVPALNFLSLLLRDRNEIAEAETLMRRALELAPREAALFNGIGSILSRKRDIAGAELGFRQAIALKPDYAEAHYNLGCALRELGRRDEAMQSLQTTLALKPAFADAMIQLAALLNEAGRRDEALTLLDRALAAEPQNFSAHYYRGLVLFELQRLDEAIFSLRQAVALRPQSYEAQYALGNALNNANQEQEALASYQKAIEASPGFIEAHVDFNALAWSMGRADLRFKSFEYAKSRIGEQTGLLLAESEQRMRFHEAAEAERLLRRALALAPERSEIRNALGRSLVMQGRMSESIPVFESAIEAQPLGISHYQELAIAHLHSRKPEEALKTVNRALAVAPFEQLTLGLLTLAYRELGDARYGSLTDVSSLVRTYDLPPPPGYSDPESFNRALAEELSRLHTRRVEPFDQTLRGGTQTMGHLFARRSSNIQMLRERISEAVADYIRSMPDQPAHPLFMRKQQEFSFRGSWSCRLRSSGYHTNHVHPQGWISSVYYVALPGEVTDARDEQGWLKFGESNLNLGALDRQSDTVQPAVGKLVLFPSYFWHGTVPFVSGDTRLTVAFDIVPGRLPNSQVPVKSY